MRRRIIVKRLSKTESSVAPCHFILRLPPGLSRIMLTLFVILSMHHL